MEVAVSATNGHISCSGKKQYAAYTDAAHVAELVRKNKDGERMAPYRCRYCQKYHIGGNGALKKGRPNG